MGASRVKRRNVLVYFEEIIEHCRARKGGDVGFPKGKKAAIYQCGSERRREGEHSGVIGCSDLPVAC